MLGKLSIGKKIRGSCAIMTVLMICISVMTALSLSSAGRRLDETSQKSESALELAALRATVAETRLSTRAFVATGGDAQYAKEYDEKIEKAKGCRRWP